MADLLFLISLFLLVYLFVQLKEALFILSSEGLVSKCRSDHMDERKKN